MPKVSKASAKTFNDHGPAEERLEVLDGYEASFVTIKEDSDLAPLLVGLPDDRCPCPHWGYVFTGKITWTTADGTEVTEAGEAFYISPGHTPKAVAGTEFILFSPAELSAEVGAQIQKNAKAMMGA